MDEITKVVAEEVVEKATEEAVKKSGGELFGKIAAGVGCFGAGAVVGWFANKFFSKKKLVKEGDENFMNDVDDDFEEVESNEEK